MTSTSISSFLRPVHDGSRHFSEPAPVLGRIGSLQVRLAVSNDEIEAAQRLRYQVFYDEMNARADATTARLQRDVDRFDAACDHLLVIDSQHRDNLGVVGTYRLLSGKAAQAAGGFYSQTEFDITNLQKAHRPEHLLELGRSCIAPSFRSRRTMELAWHGIWRLVLERNIRVMFGCASFAGADPTRHTEAFSLLSQDALLDAEYDCPPLGDNIFRLSHPYELGGHRTKTFASLPPLLKGYLRVGAKVSSHAVIDTQFDTTDVFVVLNVDAISQKYINHYGANAARFAA